MNVSIEVDDRHIQKTTGVINIADSYYYCLSNFSAHKVLFNGRDYLSSEHAYQASKFIGSNKDESHVAWSKILNAESAYLAKKYAHEYQDYYCEELKIPNFKIDLMYNILLAKVNRHDDVREALLVTRDKTIIEFTYSDSFWGQTHTGKGENWLGRLWMQIRGEIRTSL